MLVLTRKLGEKILIGDDIVVTVLDVRGDSIRLGVDAPRGVRIQRDEVVRAVAEANVAASHTDESAEERIKASLGGIAPQPAGEAAVRAGIAPQPAGEAAVRAGIVPQPAGEAAVRARPGPSASARSASARSASAHTESDQTPASTSIA